VAYNLRPEEGAAVVACIRRLEAEAVEAAVSNLSPAEAVAAVAVCILRPVAAAGANLTSDYLLTPLSRRVTRPRNCG
jgi:hypothetical protein